MRTAVALLVLVFSTMSCARSQNIDSVQVHPPYSHEEKKRIAEVAENGSE